MGLLGAVVVAGAAEGRIQTLESAGAPCPVGRDRQA